MTTQPNVLDNLAACIRALAPQYVEQYRAYVLRIFNQHEGVCPQGQSCYDRNYQDRVRFREVVQPNATPTKPCRMPGEASAWIISEEKLARNADAYAQNIVATIEAKVRAKLALLDSGEFHGKGYDHFVITGTRDGHKVVIEQQMILNCSPKGTLFNQWPSRIYVDGKFTPEARYHRMFKKEA